MGINFRAHLVPLLDIAIATPRPHGVKNPVLPGRSPLKGLEGAGVRSGGEGGGEKSAVGEGGEGLSLMPLGR